MNITKHSGIYSFTVKQNLQLSLNEAWNFFSNPSNLKKITPPEMGFIITSNNQDKMFEGQLITYKVGVLPLIKTNWVTEISNIIPLDYFIDEQRFGPYRMWHHQHKFIKTLDGVEMIDTVHFKLPFGCLGDIAYYLFIRKQLTKIFTYREKRLFEFFNK